MLITNLLQIYQEFESQYQKTKNQLHGKGSIQRLKLILQKLKNPERRFETIHIAGTSGKTSTSYLTAKILEVHNLKVGLTTSPFVLDFREKFLINGKMLTEEQSLKYFEKLRTFLDLDLGYGKLSFFEAFVVYIFIIFAGEKINIAVVEVGFGGLYDATNVLDSKNKICIINNIGLDHQKFLGDSLSEIAYQKAGIIQPYNTVFVAKQSSKINKIFKRYAAENLANIEFVTALDSAFPDLISKITNHNKSLNSNHQKLNLELALKASSEFLKRQNQFLKPELVFEALKNFQIPGRMQTLNLESNKILVDAAHNLQKLTSLIGEIQTKGMVFNILVLALKDNTDWQKKLKILLNLEFKLIICTTFDKIKGIHSIDPQKIKKYLDQQNIPSIILKNSGSVVDYLKTKINQNVLLTGSSYLVSEFMIEFQSTK
jgi:dihydrofolate synthase / folylpolyglutamate synthase